MQNKHILYITYDGLTDFLGQSQVLPYILGLEEKGYRFSILSFEKKEKFESNKNVVQTLIAGKNIQWYPKTYHKKFSILATLLDLLTGFVFLIKLHFKDAFGVVHCRSYIPAILGLLSKKIYHTKFIFDMRGFWADERVDGGLWDLKNPIFKGVYHFFKWIEKECILNANYVVTLTHNSYEEMQQWKYVTSKVLFKIIPCCADLKIFNADTLIPSEIVKLKQALTIENQIVISYLGSIGTWYMINEMLDFFKQFLTLYPTAIFLFITPEEKKAIESIVTTHGIDLARIRIAKAQRRDVPTYISLSTYSLFFIKPSYSKKSSSPTKLAEIMAMGVPVICNNNVGDVEQQVMKAKAGFIIQEFNVESYANTIWELKNTFEVHFQKVIALEYVQQNFSLENGVKSYSEIYSKIVV
jgi:glycosyltransferase involved in cell wall biosynthesis